MGGYPDTHDGALARRGVPAAWRGVASYILGFLQRRPLSAALHLQWQPTIHAAYGATEPLPQDAERTALYRGGEMR